MALTELDRKGSLLRDIVSVMAFHGGIGSYVGRIARLTLLSHMKAEEKEVEEGGEEGLQSLQLQGNSAHTDVIVAVHSHCSLLVSRARGRIRHDAMSTRPGYEGG
jgi:hypothetical protein